MEDVNACLNLEKVSSLGMKGEASLEIPANLHGSKELQKVTLFTRKEIAYLESMQARSAGNRQWGECRGGERENRK